MSSNTCVLGTLWQPAQLCSAHSTARRTCSSTSAAGPTDTAPEARSTHRFCSQASRRSTTPDISRHTRPGSACVVRAATCRAFTAVSCDMVRYTERLFCMCRAAATCSAGSAAVLESTRSCLSSKPSVCSVRSLAYASGSRSTREQLAVRHVSTCAAENTSEHSNVACSAVGICSDHALTTRCQHVSVGRSSLSRHWNTRPRTSTCAHSTDPPCGTTRTSCTDCMRPSAGSDCVRSSVVASPPARRSSRRSCRAALRESTSSVSRMPRCTPSVDSR
jgi:hypothetical protein